MDARQLRELRRVLWPLTFFICLAAGVWRGVRRTDDMLIHGRYG